MFICVNLFQTFKKSLLSEVFSNFDTFSVMISSKNKINYLKEKFSPKKKLD